MSYIRVQTEDFDVGAVLAEIRRANARIGAIATFVGLVRDVNEDATVARMRLEHYPEMTEKALRDIVTEAQARWDLVDVAIVHRVGTLEPTDQIVLVAAASAHRHDALEACAFLIDFLKTRAPFWKQESGEFGERWVASRDSDAQAARRWKT